jgi:hypothetical protein
VRKRIIISPAAKAATDEHPALDIARLAVAELSSEDPEHPIEAAIGGLGGDGWRAAEDGPQTIRLLFDEPIHVHRINLVFREPALTRQQEFVLSYRSAGDRQLREIVRQQYNFGPPDTVEEVEDYQVEQSDIVELQLDIVPDTSNRPTRASLARLRVS